MILTPAAPPAPLTRKQTRSNAMLATRALQLKWKTLIPEARTVWSKIHPEELATVQGDFHRLAGLVQMRYRVSRLEADQQTKSFLDKHYPPA